MFDDSHGFVSVPVTRSSNFACLHNKLEHARIIDEACNRHSNETVTLRKHVTKYMNMGKWMVEFFRKFKCRGTKIARINSIFMTESINLLKFCMALGSVVK